MTMFKRMLTLLTVFALCFALCACGGREEPSQSDTASDDPTQSEPADTDTTEDIVADLSQTMYQFASGLKDSDTAATVNGVAIPNELFFYLLSYDCYYMDYSYYQMGSTVDFTNEGVVDYLMSDVKSAITYYAVLHQMCAEKGVTVSEEQLTQYQDYLTQTIDASYGGDADRFYRSYGLTPESFLYMFETDYLYSNYATQVLPEPTAGELAQYVEDNGVFGVKHILLTTASQDITDEEGNVIQTATEYNTELFDRAVALLEEIKAADDPAARFDELMVEHSEDGGLTTNPDGYTFSNSDSLVGGFREATLQLEVGEISGVVTTDYGYHILLRLPVDPEDYHDACIASTLDAMLSEATESAEVVLSDEVAALDLATFYQRYMAYGLALYTEMNSTETSEK